jgi:hypothetical protein
MSVYGSWGATDAEIDAAIQFGPVPADDPSRQGAGPIAQLIQGAGTGAGTGAMAGPWGAAIGAIIGAAPAVFGIVQSAQAKRGEIGGLMRKLATTRARLQKARRPQRRQRLLAQYQDLVAQVKVKQAELADLERQAALANQPIPATYQPPWAAVVIGGVGLAGLGYAAYRITR